ncbi:SusC/RagA family TonB-linked outer membrane protein [Elizabethkingia sp. HX WHF]|uniref:SusC/RagA family TonB-linked outer membrane protein n=1 Tax=Elizabethkingia TaxID=308865 RepID=UPI00099A695C|nr:MULTISPECIES: SusC/RagA family TonB-linked outer membrane protein [Elizabethkingia]ATL45003.1 SusC/RagA family TonB-linked outer membrane protein [Elizabethkingia miricola]MCL1636765.1 SusC/RagA family TonB-linked outer membrane protein [Elizabethkingia bruuniana]MDX8564092.1 SusC/RagA family TonB-linked outer membrane protein [Elizabethkingia sp. HX WHF]OPC18850.1 SusC/RagA family protein [Elizabethkingia bruuniana]OPC56775.1 SusC/RagA family protein [Elizabethkingia bruuniana]
MKKLTNSVLVVVLSSSFVFINAQKKQDSAKTKDIEGVVVTALGIKREKKSLGYASQEVKANELFGGTTNTGNIGSQLSGKVAGLQVNTNSNFGGSTNLVIRGVKQLGGSNPLVVIDGSPVNSGASYVGNMNGGYDLGNALSDINQEDIESINVLKGAAASALYGERGLNGVIVITTKNGKGKDDGSWGVTLSSAVQAGFIDKSTFPEYQSSYGAGNYDPNKPASAWGGSRDGYNNVNFGIDGSWGPAFNPNTLVWTWESYDPTSPMYNKLSPWVAAKNGPIKFFDNPVSYVNSVYIAKGGKGNNFMLGWDNNLSNGMMPNSDMKKNTLTAKINYDFTPKLHATVYTTMTFQNTTGRNYTGYSKNIVGGFRQWWQTNVDLYSLRDAYERNVAIPSPANNYGNVGWNRTSATNGKLAFWDNPYFDRYQNYSTDERTRTFAYAELVYDLDKHINILGKVSYDNTDLLFERRLAVGSVARTFGLAGKSNTSGYDRINSTTRELNYQLMANYKYDITSNININGTVGGIIKRNYYNMIEASTEGGLNIPNIYALSNSKGTMLAPAETQYTLQTNSGFVTASLDFYKMFYVDGSFRRDVSSTLPKGNNSYNYGALSGSLILSEILKTQGTAINFWKVRGNYAETGGTAGAYQLDYIYNAAGIYNNTIGIFTPPTALPNSQLKPSRSKEFEFGTEIHLFNGRIMFDAAYYNTKTTDQIINLNISTSSGQSSKWVNAGRIDNKGFEAHLGLVPVKTKDFTWSLDANWAKNKSEVVSLAPGISSYTLNTLVGGVTLVATEGNAWGDLIGTDYQYINGQKVVDPKTGLYVKESTKVIGNVTPDWTGGLRNTLSYKGLSLSFLIDVRKGGDIYSSDMYYGLSSGLYPETAVPGYRTDVRTLPGVNPNGQPNTTPVSSAYNPQGYANNVGDSYSLDPSKRFIYDGSFVKLREASITYTLPKSVLKGTFVNDAKISLVGRNLWIIHKNLPYADPEATQMGGLYSYGNSIGTMPTTREIGVNFTVKF